MGWNEENEWEKKWWGNCLNTWGEESKQFMYSEYMGLKWKVDKGDGGRTTIDIKDVSVLDIGGGPCSLLLKTRDVKGTVVDPCLYPDWVAQRYMCGGIRYLQIKAEALRPDLFMPRFDECWMYNCLQHVDDPELIAKNIRGLTKKLRIFECVNYPVSQGHPYSLTKEWLDRILGIDGQSMHIEDKGFIADAYYGVYDLTPPESN
jgi:SAM-dependent methyltransferase